MAKTHLYQDVARVLVIAHQGASSDAPGNTLKAFDLAIALGADVLETDIHWTKDRVVVISHDETVDGASNGHGRIRDMTLKEIKKLDFGYRFSVDGGLSYPFRGLGIEIPTLGELVLRYPGIRINIDVKPKHETYIGSLIREIEHYGASGRIGLASFHHEVLRQIRERNQDISTSASPIEVARFMMNSYLPVFHHGSWPFETLQVPVSQYFIPIVTPRFVAMAKDVGIPVHVWTIDDSSEMKRLIDMGVSGIVTNRPGIARNTLNSKI